MKKFIVCMAIIIIVTACVYGCGSHKNPDVSGELKCMYQAEEYYDEQLQELEAITEVYSEKINKAWRKREISELKREFADEISKVEKKSEVLENAKIYAEDSLNSVRGLMLPYKETAEAVSSLKKISESDDVAAIYAAADKLKEMAGSASDESMYKYDVKGKSFDLNYKYTTDENGFPIFTFTADRDFKRIGFARREYIQVLCELVVNTDIDNPTPDRMLTCNGFRVENGLLMFYDESPTGFYRPDMARINLIDSKTIELHAISQEQMDEFKSNSDTFINSDNELTYRNAGDKYPLDYIVVTVYDNSDGKKYFNDRIQSVVIL